MTGGRDGLKHQAAGQGPVDSAEQKMLFAKKCLGTIAQ